MVNLDLEMILETLLNAAKRRKREREHLEGSSEGKFRQRHININVSSLSFLSVNLQKASIKH